MKALPLLKFIRTSTGNTCVIRYNSSIRRLKVNSQWSIANGFLFVELADYFLIAKRQVAIVQEIRIATTHCPLTIARSLLHNQLCIIHRLTLFAADAHKISTIRFQFMAVKRLQLVFISNSYFLYQHYPSQRVDK